MARRYVRDNRGRFASKGSGATARGGRLKTASGKKRETQTMKTSGGGVSGTIGKKKSTKLKPQQVRDLQSKSRQLKASASRNSARMGNTGISPAQGAKFSKAAAADRKAAAAIDKKLKGQATPPTVFARSSRIKGEEIGGKYKGKGKTSLYGKDLAKTSAARPGSTVRKPKGLKSGTINPKSASKPAPSAKTNKAPNNPAKRADRAASNKVAPSPRQLTKNEKIARDVMADKRFRSDRQRIAEMQRRGVSPNTDFVGLVSDAKRKGGGTAGGAPISYVNNKPKPAGSLTPKSKIRARMAAQAKASQAANAGNYQRRFQSDRTKAAAAQYRASGSKGQKYSTIKNPAPEGSAPFAVTGSTYQGRKNAAAGRAARDARPAQVSARGKVRKPAQNFKPAVPGKSAPDNARTRANKLRTAQNKVRMYSETTSRSAQNAISRRDAALRARPQGTPGNVIFRSKGRAANRFQQRASDLTQRVKSDLAFGKGKGIYSATGGGGGSGLRRRDTGDRQTSMFGKPAPLYKTSKVSSVRRRRR